MTARLRTTRVRAHAKINLDLRVLGTRPDGFHELRTVFQAISLHDTVECVAREGPFALDCDVAGVPLDASNLVWRAADALWRAVRRDGPVRDVQVRLAKRIPLQAGLGGGSADAAATLHRALPRQCLFPPRRFLERSSGLFRDAGHPCAIPCARRHARACPLHFRPARRQQRR